MWKKAARVALHNMGGLAIARGRNRRYFRILMYHRFSELTRLSLDAMCLHIARFYKPVPLSAIREAVEGRRALPENALAVTIDDGFRDFWEHGHPIFWKHNIPTTLYVVADFADQQIWLWPDKIEFGLSHSTRDSIQVVVGGTPLDLALHTPERREESSSRLTEALKVIRNDERVAFLSDFGGLCGVEIPRAAPAGNEAMNWDELRAAAAEGVEIGCHTRTHPILSRLGTAQELQHEVLGAKQYMEQRLGSPIRHFCYPNGRREDIGEAAIRCVREAGFETAVTTSPGLNTLRVDPLQINRLLFDSAIDFQYGVELMAGLHL
jgi:peptidoglycan/xylan/chitin deacetylase (PgdA/CDA1 family)